MPAMPLIKIWNFGNSKTNLDNATLRCDKSQLATREGNEIPITLQKEPGLDNEGREVLKCGFKIGGGIDQDYRKSPQGYEDNGIYVTEVHEGSPAANRSKKQSKVFEELNWECSVCTYQNAPEAFKCLMCDVRKGTSTRKPKVNLQLATQHTNSQYGASSVKTARKEDESREQPDNKRKKKFKKSWRPSKLRNVDRSSAQAREITINNLTILVTEYKVKEKRSYLEQVDNTSASEMSSQSESGFDSNNSKH
ncbi:hypothetical protein V9T40_001811 [Parthenolecanium corni]|uniref:RanBP2-type domain-containing protein n=1 Tax=Parthenolecanium corni TaxID=536013 RepID=A0AAN9TJQ0_9HEMI